MNSTPPLRKLVILQRSLRCFRFGCCSLIPVVGVVPAVFAFREFLTVTRGQGGQWNAAHPQMLVGVWFAIEGVACTFALLTILAVAFLSQR